MALMKIYDYNGKKNICGDRVRQARRASDLTQTELAECLRAMGVDIERDSVSRLEAGERFVADYVIFVFAVTRGAICDKIYRDIAK